MRWFSPKLTSRPRPVEVPHRLRAIVRARESSIIVLAVAIGLAGGLVVAAMSEAVGLMHMLFFGLDPGERLSAQARIDPLYAFLMPCLGGLLFGLATAYITRRRGTEVDPIEANALHGGRMSLRGSLIVAAQTVWSSGIGASVGLEAGYTQLASGIASKLGRAFRLRRSDMRVLVGCGAAGGHRRRLRRAAGRRLLCLRTDDRQLFDRQPGAGRHGVLGRLSDRAGLRARPARHRNRRRLRSWRCMTS